MAGSPRFSQLTPNPHKAPLPHPRPIEKGGVPPALFYRLHLENGATRGDVQLLLQGAVPPLERLLYRVQTIPLEGPFAERVPSDFDAWVRWSGARLEDILASLRHAMAA